jgi:hypothetical protein
VSEKSPSLTGGFCGEDALVVLELRLSASDKGHNHQHPDHRIFHQISETAATDFRNIFAEDLQIELKGYAAQ